MDSFYHKKLKRWIPSAIVSNDYQDTWNDFCIEMRKLSEIPIEEKEQAPLISPAFYDNEVYRKNVNVTGWSFLSLDIDDGRTTVEQALTMMQQLELNFLIYTTASSRSHHHKFRIMIPFDRYVLADELDDIWHSGYQMFGRISDISCKDKSRGYYIPGLYPNANNFIGSEGDLDNLSPDEMMVNFPPPRETTLETLRHKIQQKPFIPAGRSYHWSNIHNCPFIKQAWISEYLNRSGPGHYAALYTFMLRTASSAKNKGYAISSTELARLAAELDIAKDGRWQAQGRNWIPEAENAIQYVMGRN